MATSTEQMGNSLLSFAVRARGSTCGTSAVTVSAPARVHFGLLQMSDGYPTLNMGVGAALSWPRWTIRARLAERNAIGAGSPLVRLDEDVLLAAEEVLDRLTERFAGQRMEISVVDAIPAHVGLGSKTSLLCGLTAAGCGLADTWPNWTHHRDLTGRGGTSGIGINVSALGGVILDSGHEEPDERPYFAPSRLRAGRPIPRVAARWKAAAWPWLIVTPLDARQFHGQVENELLDGVTPIPTSEVEKIAAVVLYELIPGFATGAYHRVAGAISTLQGFGLKKRQWAVQSGSVPRVRDRLLALGADCVALSSTGPSLLVLAPDPRRMVEALRRFDDCTVEATSFLNHGIRCRRDDSSSVD